MSVDPVSNTSTGPSQATLYRPSTRIPDHIREHCHIYLDEQLYTSALSLLADLITAGASHLDGSDRPVYAPLPYHIELVGCLLIHPRNTSHISAHERKTEIASRSITLLRNLLVILGPVNAKLAEAFSLSPLASRRFRRTRNVSEIDAEIEDASSGSESEHKSEHMRGHIANLGRTRRCAKDFWHILGWAFNCSVKYPERWKYWKVWLSYMLDVLDEDWQERERLDSKREESWTGTKHDPDAGGRLEMVRRSLLVQYLSEVRGRSSPLKRVVRSAFADGGSLSLKDFPEVFPNETRSVSHGGQKRKRHDQFGPYEEEEDEEGDSGLFSKLSGVATPDTGPSDVMDDDESADIDDPYLGGPDSIALRQRVVTLLSRVAAHLPEAFAPLRTLYDAIEECTRQLPIPAFVLFVSQSNSSNFPTNVYVSLTQLLLIRLLPSNASRGRIGGDELTQKTLESCLLPFPAITSSIDDNTKVSILLENSFKLLLKNCNVEYTEKFARAVETGILARENKIKGDKRRRDGRARSKEDEFNLTWLRASGTRLRSLLHWVEQSQGRV